MSFFYDLNKKLDGIRATPEVTHQQLNERDEGKPGKNFAKIAKDAGDRYGSKAAGERVAGSIRNKLRDQGKLEEMWGDPYHDNAKVDAINAANPPKAPSGKPNRFTPTPVKHHTYNRKSVASNISGKDSAAYDYRGQVEEESGEWSKIPVGVIDGPGGYEGGQQRIKDYESGKIDKNSKPLPPAVNKPRPAPKDNGMGRIVQGTWQADPKGKVPAPSGDPEGVKEAAGSIDYEKVLEAIAALYGDDMWNNDAMGELAQDLEQAGPTDRELDFIIAKGKLPTRLKNIRFTNTDDVQFGHLDEKNGAPMTATGKKLNFADKIANAKKEVDEMLGDVAAEAMRSALSPKQKKMAALGGNPERIDGPDLAALRKGAKMGEERSKGTAFDMSTPRVDTPKAGSTERGSKHDITHSTSDPRYKGRTVIRRTDAQGISVGGETDDEGNKKEKRTKAGRPDGTGKKIGAKGPSGNSKLITKVDEVDIRDQGEYDQEGDMAKDDIKTIVRHAQALSKVLGDNDNLPEWVQSKLAKIEGMMISIDEYMQNQASDDGEERIAEEPRSKNQAVAARIARGVQKGTTKAKSGSASAEMAKMQPKELNKFAKGSTKGLPKKVSKKKEVDENSEEGRLTTTRTGPGQTSTSSSTGRISATVDKGQVTVKPAKSSGISYGQGIYDSMNHELEQMIAESMNISMSDSTEGNKSLTITATDDDAMKLGMLLKNAGLGGGQDHGEDFANQLQHDEHNHPGAAFGGEEVCDTCGMQDCGCGDIEQSIDENAPDWPTNTEQADNNFGYSGGLNKPKADVAGNGQSTVPVVATRPHNDDLRRMMEMAGIKEWEVKLDSPPRTGSYPDQLYGKDKERYDAVQTGSGPESQKVQQYYQNKNAGSYDSGQKYTDERDADYADRLNAARAGRIANNELTPGEWIQKGTNAVRKAFGGQDKPLKPAKTVVDLDGPSNYPSARYVGSDDANIKRYLDPKADAAYKARQKALFPDDFKEGKGDGNLANNAKPYDKVTQGDVIAGRLGKDEKGGKEKQVEESIFALTNQWKAYKG